MRRLIAIRAATVAGTITLEIMACRRGDAAMPRSAIRACDSFLDTPRLLPIGPIQSHQSTSNDALSGRHISSICAGAAEVVRWGAFCPMLTRFDARLC